LSLLENLADPRPSFQEWRAVRLAEDKLVRSFRVSRRRRASLFKLATVKDAAVPPAPPNQETEVRVDTHALCRGVLRFTGVTLARPDPLGLLAQVRHLAAAQTALILPKRYPMPPIALPGTMKYQEGGVALAASVGQSEEFVALRDYRNAIRCRHIHWRSWARLASGGERVRG